MTSAAIQILREAGALTGPGLLDVLPAVGACGPHPHHQPLHYRYWLLKLAIGVLIGPWKAPQLAWQLYLAGPNCLSPASRVPRQAISS